jgi:hypothetical protein
MHDTLHSAFTHTNRTSLLSGSSQDCEKRLLVSSCLSVRPHGTSGLPVDGFSLNLIFEHFFFRNMARKFKFHYNLTKITGTLHEDPCTFTIISRSILTMRNVSDKISRKNQNTYFMFNNFFPKVVLFMR